jgi:signal transduction histidine kinase
MNIEVESIILEKKEQELEKELAKMNSILTSICHDLRSPIHGISGILNFLNENCDTLNKEEIKSQISKTLDNMNYLKEFTDSFLDLLKIQNEKISFDFKEIDLLQIILNNVERCKNCYIFDKNIKFTFDFSCNIAIINGDNFRINQLFLNLLTNAVKFAGQDGIIVLGLDICEKRGTKFWKFSLSDSGIGIPDEELEYIFEEYSQSSRTRFDSNFKGTGLGLAICKEIVNAHNGYIWAENNEYGGAKFVVLIPLVE